MSIFSGPVILYLKFNLILILALGLWLAVAYCGGALSIHTGSKGKLVSARWLLLCTLVFPLLIQGFSIPSPVNSLTDFYHQHASHNAGSPSVVSDTVANLPGLAALVFASTKETSLIQQYNLPLLFWLLIATGMIWRAAITQREVVTLKRLIDRSHVYKHMGSLRVLFSDEIYVPLATRFIGKSYIIFPSNILLSSKSVSMVLRHEGEHLRTGICLR